MRYVLVIAGLMLTGCVTDYDKLIKTTPVPTTLPASQMANVKSAVTHSFFDPDSALFRDVRTVRFTSSKPTGNPRTVTCGFVNGKNRFGGYVGYTPFFVELDNKGLLTNPGRAVGRSDSYNLGIKNLCEAVGLPV